MTKQDLEQIIRNTMGRLAELEKQNDPHEVRLVHAGLKLLLVTLLAETLALD